jgi:hypothetical protein
MNEPIFDGSGLRVHPHNFVAAGTRGVQIPGYRCHPSTDGFQHAHNIDPAGAEYYIGHGSMGDNRRFGAALHEIVGFIGYKLAGWM